MLWCTLAVRPCTVGWRTEDLLRSLTQTEAELERIRDALRRLLDD